MKKAVLSLLATLILWGCTDSTPTGPDVDDFDREAILVNWADNLISPALTHFASLTEELNTAASTFSEDPTQQNLDALRDEWLVSYKAWQHVSMFEMGEAMQLRYRDNLNIYPTDTVEIRNNIEEGSYNLELPSLNNSQGFPALDYLLYGLADSDTDLLSFYTTDV
ncbi:MAG: imelysin family protein, partial [Balneolaceae bacterium]